MPPISGPLHTLASFQRELDDLSGPESPSILLTRTLRAKLSSFLSAHGIEPATSTADARAWCRSRRRKTLVQEIDDEAENLLNDQVHSPDAHTTGRIATYAQRLERLRASSSLHSLQPSAHSYLRDCFLQQRASAKRPKNTRIAHRHGGALDGETHVYLSVFGQESLSVVSTEAKLSRRATLVDLVKAIGCTSARGNTPFLSRYDPMEFLYLNGVFYVEPFPPTKDMVEYVVAARTLLGGKNDSSTPSVSEQIAPLQGTRLDDVPLQFDAVSGCYCHIGTGCQHTLLFHDATGVPSRDTVVPHDAPPFVQLYAEAQRATPCDACGLVPAATARYFDETTPHHPTMLCAFCHKRLQEDYARPADGPTVVIDRCG